MKINPKWIAGLQSADESQRYSSIAQLHKARINGLGAELTRLTQDSSESVSCAAVVALAELGGEDCLQTLHQLALNDPSRAVRERAIWALSYRAQPESIPILRELLIDSEMRQPAAQALSHLLNGAKVELPTTEYEEEVTRRDRAQIPALLSTLKSSQDADERILAAETLYQIAEGRGPFPELLDPFLGALEDADTQVASYAVSGLQALSRTLPGGEFGQIADFVGAFPGLCEVAGRWGIQRAVPGLLQWAEGSDTYSAWAALEALARLGHPEAFGLLSQSLLNPSTRLETRLVLAESLGKSQNPQAGPVLLEALKKSRWTEEGRLVRKLAEALGRQGFQQALPDLLLAYRGSHPNSLKRKPSDFLARVDLEEHCYQTCTEILRAIVQLNTQEVLSFLLEEINSPYAALRALAAQALAGQNSQERK